MILRALSYNTHKSRAFFSRRRTWQELLELIKKTKPDLIFLQEFLRERSAEEFLEELTDEIWPHHSIGKNKTIGDFHYGNAILSRFPIQKTENVDLSNSSLERRGLLYGQIEPISGHKLHLFCCHLDLRHESRTAQLKKIKTAIQELAPGTSPMLLAGDFNDWRKKLHPSIQRSLGVKDSAIAITGRMMPSFPSIYPMFSLDRIYFRRVSPVNFHCSTALPWYLRSDHLPLIVEFKF